MLTLDPQRLDSILCRPVSRRLAEPHQRVAMLAEFLSPQLRAIVLGVYIHRLPIRYIAQLTGLSPGQVSRCARGLLGRLANPVVLALAMPTVGLTTRQRAIAVGRFAIGRSATKLSTELNVSVATVRREIDFLRGWARGVQSRSRFAP